MSFKQLTSSAFSSTAKIMRSFLFTFPSICLMIPSTHFLVILWPTSHLTSIQGRVREMEKKCYKWKWTNGRIRQRWARRDKGTWWERKERYKRNNKRKKRRVKRQINERERGKRRRKDSKEEDKQEEAVFFLTFILLAFLSHFTSPPLPPSLPFLTLLYFLSFLPASPVHPFTLLLSFLFFLSFPFSFVLI